MNHSLEIQKIDSTYDTILCDIIYPSSVTIGIGMIKSEVYGGNIVWRSLGQRYTTFKASCEFETDIENGAKFEKYLKGPVQFSFDSYNGFFPITPLFSYESIAFKYVIESASIKPSVNLFGHINSYKITYIPAYDNVFDCFTELAGIETESYKARCSWTLDNHLPDMKINLPGSPSSFSVDNNTAQDGLLLNGSFSCLDTYEVKHNEITNIKLTLDQGACTKLLSILIKAAGNKMTLIAPKVLAIFGQQYNTNYKKDLDINFDVILADKDIKITHTNYDQFDVSFKLQVVGHADVN